MITEDQAREIAIGYINQPDPYWVDKPKMVVTRTENADLGWLFYWRTVDPEVKLAGNGPIYVCQATGDFEPTGSRPPLSDQIKLAEERLKTKIEQGGAAHGAPRRG
jgi:hypothetical protein